MLQKIKDLMKIQEEIDNVSKKFNENISLTKQFNENVSSLKKEIDSLKDSQGKMVTQLKQDTDIIKELKDELKKEITDFKMVKSRLEKKLVEKFEEEIKEELLPRFDRIEREVRNFEELGKNVAIISQRAVELSSELQKFCDVSKEIKKGDFELTRHAANLSKMENEKLELMRKIDSLERLVSKMRRQR